MASLPDLEDALRNAHASGDTASAQKLADAIFQVKYGTPSARRGENRTVAGPTPEEQNAVQSLPFGQSLPVGPLTIAAGSALVGAGRTGSKIEQGNQQLYDLLKMGVKNSLGANTDQEFQNLTNQAQTQQQNDAAYAPLRQQHPFMTGMGETLPAVGIPVGQATAVGRILAPALGLSGMEAAQYGSPQQRLVGGAKGFATGLGGGAVGEGLNTLISPAASSLSAARQSAVNAAADKLGIVPLPSELTGNQTMAGVEDMLSRLPLSRNVFGDISSMNRKMVNRAAASAMGENSDGVTKDVFNAAKKNTGAELDRLRGQTDMPVTSPVFDAITQSEKTLNSGLKVNGKADALQLLSDLKDRLYNTKQLDGPEYQAIVSDLKTAARGTDNDTIAAVYKNVIKAMDAQAQGSNASAWDRANKQYASYKTLVQPGVVNEVTGDVNPGALSRTMGNNLGEATKTGAISGPLSDIADYYKAMPQMRAGSPTFERGANNSMLQWMLSPGYWAMAKGMTSPIGRAYLSRGLLGDPTISDAVGNIAGRAALPLAASQANQALFNMGLLGYAQ